LRSNPYATYVLQRLHEYEPPSLKAECAELKLVSRKSLSVLAPPQFVAGSTIPEGGQWIDHAIVNRCGTNTQRNLLIIARGQKQLQAVALLPGETIASPLLQRDAMTSGMVPVTVKLGCDHRSIAVIDTALSGPVAQGVPWKEDWTYAGCGKMAVVTITFSPDGKGGAYFSATLKP
jgi:hypothetical protein